jgi:hypothetical protein
MSWKDEVKESEMQSLRTGKLCEGVAPLSLERWDFWRRRLAGIAADCESLELGDSVVERIAEVLRSMDAVDGRRAVESVIQTESSEKPGEKVGSDGAESVKAKNLKPED